MSNLNQEVRKMINLLYLVIGAVAGFFISALLGAGKY